MKLLQKVVLTSAESLAISLGDSLVFSKTAAVDAFLDPAVSWGDAFVFAPVCDAAVSCRGGVEVTVLLSHRFTLL